MGEEYGETAPFPYFIDHGDPQLVEAVRAGRAAEFAGHDWSGGVADPADPETFRRAKLQPDQAEREPHRALLAMYTELLRIRRATQVLTDPAAVQTVECEGATITIVRAALELGATKLILNFGDGAVDAATEPDMAVLFDSSDPRWGGATEDPKSAVSPWSARLLQRPIR
jgi:maltooligosyltrehalose trehalohydrolase